MPKTNDLRDAVIRQLMESGERVSFSLINGYPFTGVIVDVGSDAIIVNTKGQRRMVFKHAISTIVLPDAVEADDKTDAEQEA
jgi:host factor-I protein